MHNEITVLRVVLIAALSGGAGCGLFDKWEAPGPIGPYIDAEGYGENPKVIDHVKASHTYGDVLYLAPGLILFEPIYFSTPDPTRWPVDGSGMCPDSDAKDKIYHFQTQPVAGLYGTETPRPPMTLEVHLSEDACTEGIGCYPGDNIEFVARVWQPDGYGVSLPSEKVQTMLVCGSCDDCPDPLACRYALWPDACEEFSDICADGLSDLGVVVFENLWGLESDLWFTSIGRENGRVQCEELMAEILSDSDLTCQEALEGLL